MCIRDSLRGTRLHSEAAGALPDRLLPALRDQHAGSGSGAVSYTHLVAAGEGKGQRKGKQQGKQLFHPFTPPLETPDVYKRQSARCFA